MTLVLVEVANEAAVEMLRQQHGLRVVGVVAEPAADKARPEQPVPRKWAGSLTSADADSLRAHVEQVRNEWERDTQ